MAEAFDYEWINRERYEDLRDEAEENGYDDPWEYEEDMKHKEYDPDEC